MGWPSPLGVGVWPFLLEVVVVGGEGGGPFLLGVFVCPFLLGFGLALSSRGVVVGLLEVVFGPSLLGLAFPAVGGVHIPPRGGGLPRPSRGCPSSGVNWSCLFGVGVGP